MTEKVTITVPTTGTCSQGHSVTHNLTTTVPQGSGGVATARANCGACGSLVYLSGSFSA
jgi:hypothetical protein